MDGRVKPKVLNLGAATPTTLGLPETQMGSQVISTYWNYIASAQNSIFKATIKNENLVF